MTTIRCTILVSLGLAFCLGCGDSNQPWESKAQPSGRKKPKLEGTVNNDTTDSTTEPDKMTNPHGDNPHAGMQMPAAASDEPLENDGKLDADSVHWTVPKSWVRKTPKTSMVRTLAEYGIPKAEGAKADGRLTVTQAGGGIEGNITRWQGQFSSLDKEKPQEAIEVGGIKVTLVDLSGTFEDGPMMGPKVSCPEYRMLGAIFQLPNDTMQTFVKCYGPKKTIDARADEIKSFIKSLKVDK
jgi:hypothetical protein